MLEDEKNKHLSQEGPSAPKEEKYRRGRFHIMWHPDRRTDTQKSVMSYHVKVEHAVPPRSLYLIRGKK